MVEVGGGGLEFGSSTSWTLRLFIFLALTKETLAALDFVSH